MKQAWPFKEPMVDTNQIAEDISILMPAIARRILLKFFQSVEISQSQLLMIMSIYAKGTCRLSELSQEMEISNPTASGLVERLVQNEYVKRSADPNDRRAVCISLTKKGLQIANKFRQTIKKKWYDILITLPKKDQEDYIRIMREIGKKIS